MTAANTNLRASLKYFRPLQRVIAIRTWASSGKWLDPIIAAATLLHDSSDLVPIPFLRPAAGAVVILLQRIKVARNNRDDLRRLSQKLLDAITSIRDSILESHRSRSPSPEIIAHCFKFAEKLFNLQAGIDDIVRGTNSWNFFLKTTEITNTIKEYKERVDDLRSDFLIACVVDIRVRVAEGQPQQALIPTSTFLYLIDALDVTSPVSMDVCSNPSQFNDYIKLKFSNRLGSKIVNRGDFSLSVLEVATGSPRQLGENLDVWLSLIKPGVTVTMYITLKQRGSGLDDRRQCPSCHAKCSKEAFPGDEVRCLQCGVLFHVSRAIISEVNANKNSTQELPTVPQLKVPDIFILNASDMTRNNIPRNNACNPMACTQRLPDTDSYRHFRRFHVLLSKIMERSGRLSNTNTDEALQRRVLVERREALGSNHQDTLQAMENLALTLQTIGNLWEAEDLQRHVLRVRQETLGSRHPDNVDAMAQLASTLYLSETLDEAEHLQRHVLRARREAFGSHHPNTVYAMAQLASTLHHAERFDEVEVLDRRILRANQEALGSAHPDTLQAMTNLASILRVSGKFQEAEDLQRRALCGLHETFGSSHPSTLQAMKSLALILQVAGNFQEAEDLQRLVLQVLPERHWGRDHPDTVYAMARLASTFYRVGKLDQAEALQRRVLIERQEAFESDYPATFDAMTSLALTLCRAGKLHEAEDLQRRALTGLREAFGSAHPNTIQAMANLALTLQQTTANLKEAEDLQRCVFTERQETFGSAHSDTLQAMMSLASIL